MIQRENDGIENALRFKRAEHSGAGTLQISFFSVQIAMSRFIFM